MIDDGRKKLLVAVVVVLLSCGCCLLSPLIALGSILSGTAKDFRNQCDSALGPDPSVTAAVTQTPAPTPGPEPTPGASAVPSTNPYASVTLDPQDTTVPDRYRACVKAIREAPYQPAEAIRTPNAGVAVTCAQQLALRYEAESSGDPAALARDVIYAASAAVLSGQCVPVAAPAGSDTVPSGCGDPTGPRRAVILPETVARQGFCGQQVVAGAVSAGDLIFWDYRDNAATRVGIAVSTGEMVTGDPGGGRFFRMPIPDTDAARFKRVLGGEL